MWYLQNDHPEDEPLSLDELVELAENGEIGPDTRVREEDGEWMAAEDVKALAAAFKPDQMRLDHGPAVLVFAWISLAVCMAGMVQVLFERAPRDQAIDAVLQNPTGLNVASATAFLAARCWPALLGMLAGTVAWLKFAQPGGRKVLACGLMLVGAVVAMALMR